MHNLIRIVLIVLISGCSSQKYFLTTDSNEINNFQAKKYHDGDLLTLNERYYIQTKAILIPDEFIKTQEIKLTVELIQRRKYYQLEKYLKTLDKSNPYLPITSGLLKIYQNRYKEALSSLKANRLTDIQYIVDILIIDCEYELILLDSSKPDYYLFLEKYQKILDQYNLDQYYKSIINNRMKFVRYKI